MVYESLPSGLEYILVSYDIDFVIVWILTIFLYTKWRIRRTNALKFLFYAILIFAISNSALALGFNEAYYTGYKKEIYQATMYLANAGYDLGTLFYIRFAAELFGIQKSQLKKYEIALGICLILVILPNNYYGLPSEDMISFGPSIRIVTTIINGLLLYVIYCRLYFKAQSTYKKMVEKNSRIGFFLLLIAQACMIHSFVYLVLDGISFTFFTDPRGFSIFYFLSLVCVNLFIFTSTLTMLVPNWYSTWMDLAGISQIITNSIISTEKGNENVSMSSSAPKKVEISPFEDGVLQLECPICHKTILHKLSNSLILQKNNSQKGILNLMIPQNLICEHSFIAYIDKYFNVRGYETTDGIIK